jgi:hypothetical protein
MDGARCETAVGPVNTRDEGVFGSFGEEMVDDK